MFERFTDQARRVVVLAQEEARALGHNYIGTEHLLLGLIRENSGVGANALRSFGVSLEDVRRDVVEIIGPSEMPPAADPPFTRRVKKVFELSLREALQLSNNYIGTEHILLAVIREGEGVACQVLTRAGVDLGAVRQRVVQLIHEGPGPQEPRIGAEFVTQSVRMTAGGIVDPAEMPHCPACRTSMAGNLRSRLVPVHDERGLSTAHLFVVYCTKCGVAIETRIEGQAQ